MKHSAKTTCPARLYANYVSRETSQTRAVKNNSCFYPDFSFLYRRINLGKSPVFRGESRGGKIGCLPVFLSTMVSPTASDGNYSNHQDNKTTYPNDRPDDDWSCAAARGSKKANPENSQPGHQGNHDCNPDNECTAGGRASIICAVRVKSRR